MIGSANQISNQRTNTLLEELARIAHRGVRQVADVAPLDGDYWDTLKGQVGSSLGSGQAAYSAVILQHETNP